MPKQTSEEERETVLTRQAIRVALLNQQPDLSALQKHGWTLDDVHSLANSMSQKNNFERLG